MGPKITIDSATLMNKGLELIEAHHLFALAPDEIDVLVHPQSAVHGLVEFRDGSVVAQLGPPDMRVPIAHCLAWPARIDGPAPRLDLARLRELTFEEPGSGSFPGPGLGAPGDGAGRGGADGVERGRRGRGGGIPSAAGYRFRRLPRWSRRRWTPRNPAACWPTRQASTTLLAVDHVARSLARDILLNNAVKAS